MSTAVAAAPAAVTAAAAMADAALETSVEAAAAKAAVTGPVVAVAAAMVAATVEAAAVKPDAAVVGTVEIIVGAYAPIARPITVEAWGVAGAVGGRLVGGVRIGAVAITRGGRAWRGGGIGGRCAGRRRRGRASRRG
jgi:hypothetical protein